MESLTDVEAYGYVRVKGRDEDGMRIWERRGWEMSEELVFRGLEGLETKK